MKNISFIIACLLFSVTLINGQNLLRRPEHIVFDKVNQQYLVTNYGNGKIISINQHEEQEIIIEGISGCLGIHIVDTTIFISAEKKIYLYGLCSHRQLRTLTLNVSNWLDGMIDDGAGNLYVVENAGKIHKVNLTDFTETIIVSSGLPQYPQDLAYDPVGNRLLVVCWQINSPIIAIDLDTYDLSELIQTTSGQFDGIVRDNLGNLYVTSWLSGGRVYQWEYPYSEGPTILNQGHSGPAGLELNDVENVLVVPNFNGNSVSYIQLVYSAIKEEVNTLEIKITGDVISVECNREMELNITDMTGRVIFHKKYNASENHVSLHNILKNNIKGMYLINIRSDNQVRTVKFIH